MFPNTIPTVATKMSRTTEYRYNVDGLLEELVCHNGVQEQVTRWEYGVDESTGSKVARADLVRAKIYPDGATDRVEYGYNRLSAPIQYKDQNGTVHAYEYDALGRMTFDKATALAGGLDDSIVTLGVAYTTRGEVQRITSFNAFTDPVNEVDFTYNGFSQVTGELQKIFGVTEAIVSYEYADASGASNTMRRTGISYPTSTVINYAYEGVLGDALSRISGVIDNTFASPQVLAFYAYIGVPTPVITKYPVPTLEMSAITTTGEPLSDAGDPYASLDRFGRFQEARWRQDSTEVERVQFGFDRTSNIRWRHNLITTSEGRYDEVYAYDGLYQLQALARGNLNQNRTAIGGSPAWQEAWKYDEMGNWLDYKTVVSEASGSPLIGFNQARSYNAANELLFINDSNAMVAHDPVGNMLRAPMATAWDDETPLIAQTYVWDAWNRLTEARSGSEATLRLGQYQYDGLNRRIFKHEEIDEVSKDRYLYYSDQWQVLEQQTDTEGTIDRQFVWGIKGLDDLILRQLISEVPLPHYSINDGKNVTAVANESGTIVERYAYRGFGFSEVLDASFAPISGNSSEIEWETRFCGYRLDLESSLYCVRFRYYHSMLGRWLSKDPLMESGGQNLFAYVGNQCIMFHDFMGLALDLANGPVGLDVTTDAVQGRVMPLEWKVTAKVYPLAAGNLCYLKLGGGAIGGSKIELNLESIQKTALKYLTSFLGNVGRVYGHERMHVTINRAFWNRFADWANQFEGFWCNCECANLASQLVLAGRLLMRNRLVIAQAQFEISDYTPEELASNPIYPPGYQGPQFKTIGEQDSARIVLQTAMDKEYLDQYDDIASEMASKDCHNYKNIWFSELDLT